MKKMTLILFSLASLLLAGCATDSSYVERSTVRSVEHGTITRLVLQPADKSGALNLGTILGGAAGGIIGHQFGGGSGKTALTIAGAVGGAVAGTEVQKSTEKDRYEITVRLNNGNEVVVDQVGGSGNFRVGDRVRLEDNKLYRE